MAEYRALLDGSQGATKDCLDYVPETKAEGTISATLQPGHIAPPEWDLTQTIEGPTEVDE